MCFTKQTYDGTVGDNLFGFATMRKLCRNIIHLYSRDLWSKLHILCLIHSWRVAKIFDFNYLYIREFKWILDSDITCKSCCSFTFDLGFEMHFFLPLSLPMSNINIYTYVIVCLNRLTKHFKITLMKRSSWMKVYFTVLHLSHRKYVHHNCH